jgi:hypothetical protein
MAATKEVSFSLSDLDVVSKCSNAFEFEYLTPSGDKSGIFFSVLGANSDVVMAALAERINSDRNKEAMRQLRASKSRPGNAPVEVTTFEDDVDAGKKLAAVRLVGWRGIKEPFTPENALRLCYSNPLIAGQITEQSENLANFSQV